MTKVYERDNASTGSSIYRTPITNRRRRTSTCSTGASASSSSTMLVPEPKAPSKEPSRASKMARMPLSILRKFSGLGSSHGSTASQDSAAAAAAAAAPASGSGSGCKAEERKKSSHRSLLDAFTWRSTKSLQSSKSDASLDSMGEEQPASMRRPAHSSFPKFSEQTTCKVRSIEVTKRALTAGSGWRKHRRLNMAIRFSENNTKVELRIDAKWTVEEIRTLVGILYEFRLAVEEAVIDAPICELLVAAIAEINLDKWYAFQCFMKALCVEDIHLTGVRSTKPNEIYWPRLKRLIVNTTPAQAPHLSRLLDYGVADDRLVDRQQIELVHINIVADEQKIEHAQMTKITKDINNFRCWAGSAGFDERFHVGPYTVA